MVAFRALAILTDAVPFEPLVDFADVGGTSASNVAGRSSFSLAPPPAGPDRTEKKLQSRDVAVASVPPCSFRRASGSKNGGTEATATVFGKSLGECSIPF